MNYLAKTVIAALLMVFLPSLMAEKALLAVDVDITNKERLQRGAKFFMNYCSGCHSLRYMRYNRMATDLGLMTYDGEVDKDLVNNLIFTKAPIHAPIEIAMPATDARQWFGVVPPDLSLIARQHSADWIYTYLLSFYQDPSRPFGSNNALVPNVAMPNILAPLIGTVLPITDPKTGVLKSPDLYVVGDGSMQRAEFEDIIQDIVTFLVYVGEPMQVERKHMGIFVLIYLGIFLCVIIRLKKNYWKVISPPS